MNQKGGVIFKNIITMENKDQFVGFPVRIIRLDDFDVESAADPVYRPYMPGGADLNGSYPLTTLAKEAGFVADDDPQDVVNFAGTPFVDVHYPNLDDTVPIYIPNNLNELAHREPPRDVFNFYLEVFNKPIGRLSRLKSGPFFTAENLKRKNKQSRKRRFQRNALTSPSIRHASVTTEAGETLELPDEILKEIAEKITAGEKKKKKKKKKKNTKKKRKKNKQ
tara:strand:- start:1137 stop:1802 length:666 start_codon:yes stop_codon:yes gene_type:complete